MMGASPSLLFKIGLIAPAWFAFIEPWQKKTLLLALPLLLLSSCLQENAFENQSGSIESESFNDEPDGGTVTFTASALPMTPKKEETKVTILGHEFVYCNVYNDGQDNFVLQDDTSYIRNYDIIFGLSFSKGLARAYDISNGKDGLELCEDFHEGEEEQSYSVYQGFEITIDKTLSSHHYDENIGKIVHWC